MPQWMSWLKSNEKEILAILNNLACKAEEVSKLLVELFSDFDKLNDQKSNEINSNFKGNLLYTFFFINNSVNLVYLNFSY